MTCSAIPSLTTSPNVEGDVLLTLGQLLGFNFFPIPAIVRIQTQPQRSYKTNFLVRNAMLSAVDLGGRLDFNCAMDPAVLVDAAIRGDFNCAMDSAVPVDAAIRGDFNCAMDSALLEATIRGEIPYLISLRNHNPKLLETFLLDSSSGTPPPTTPLHIASLLGHTAFAAELIQLLPELTEIKDSQGLLPIHLAAARGHSDLVVAMLRHNQRLGTIANKEGRSAVHLAAACGRIEVIHEMLKFNPNLAKKVSEVYGETMLHTSVKHGHLDATRFICTTCSDLVCGKDSDGNTALHVAVTKRNALIVNFLLKDTNVDVNTENNDGYTALDLALKSDMGYVDGDFCRMMVCARASKGRGPTKNATTDGEERKEELERAWFADVQNTILIVATVIVGATFQSGMDNASGNPQFRFFNALSMGSSMALILFLASGTTGLKSWITTRLLLMLLWVSLTSMTLSYGTFIFHKEGSKNKRSKIATAFVAGISSLLVLLFISHLSVLVLRIYKKLVKKRELSDGWLRMK